MRGNYRNRSGRRVSDLSRRYTVALPVRRVGELRHLLRQVANTSDQECIDFVVSHVLAGRKDFSLDVLKKILDLLGMQLDLVPTAEVYRKATALGGDDPAERLRQLSYHISTLENLKARAAALSPSKRASVVPDTPGLFPDGLEGLRTRLRNGQSFDEAVAAELAEALGEQAKLARRIAQSAESRRELVVGGAPA